jgi:hypothetical protein
MAFQELAKLVLEREFTVMQPIRPPFQGGFRGPFPRPKGLGYGL